MNFENLKLQMYQIENQASVNANIGNIDDLHIDADTILLEALDQLTPLVLDADQHDALVDVIAAYKRASKNFYYV